MILFSFILDGISSLYISFLIPLFTLTTITLKSRKLKIDELIKYSLFYGLLYDIVYTNTLGLNSLVFFSLTYIMYYFKKKNIYLINIFVIIAYLFLINFILTIFDRCNFNILTYLIITLKSIITNTLYLFILNFVLKKNKRIKLNR